MSIAVSAKNLVFSYPNDSKNVLDNFSIEIEEGSYTAIVGVNGSGKSTFARIISGILCQKAGSFEIKNGLKTGIVLQSPKDQIICGIVHRDTAFGPEVTGFSKSETELMTIESLKATGMLDSAQKKSLFLSLGQTQKVAISGILAIKPDILILDEAVSMLDPQSKEEILTLLETVNKNGITILHITHDMETIVRAKNIVAMKKGKLLWQGSLDELFLSKNADMLSYIKGPDLPKNTVSLENTSAHPKKTITLSAKNIDFFYDKNQCLHNVSLDFEKGTLTSITGPSGSGKTTLLEVLAGLKTAHNGKIFANEHPALCQQNSDAALFEVFAADDVAFGARNTGLKGKELKKIVHESMDKVSLPFDAFAAKQTTCLSGGEKRRLSIAGILALNRTILLFDEPTAGLDGEARYNMMLLLKSLAKEGKTVIFTTHRTDEASFSDKNIIIENGHNILSTARSDQIPEEHKRAALPELPPLPCAKLIENFSKIARNLSEDSATKSRLAYVQKLPPALKYILFLTIFFAGLFVRPFLLCGILLGFSVLYALFSAYPAKKLFLAMIKLIPLLLFFFVFQMIFASPAPNDKIFLPYKYFLVTQSKLLHCLKILLHSECALCSICAFKTSSTEVDIISGFEDLLLPLRLIHIPIQNAVVLMEIIFRFIPLLLDEAISIFKTQSIRGALKNSKGFFAKVRSIVPLIVPLITQTIKRSEILADALTARGFSFYKR
ncbi:MAG: ATP-binding cassette domain-containing protein [Treponema sp.]|nr:ATP-binding cassette domain-containing protein [Treponema sp.]MBD5413587.1 ATP-binding cassette domain-containing protein [Treponema sp.]